MNIVPVGKSSTEQAIADLEKIIERLKSGKDTVSHGVVVYRDAVNETIGVSFIGQSTAYSNALGLLSWAQMHCYDLSQNG